MACTSPVPSLANTVSSASISTSGSSSLYPIQPKSRLRVNEHLAVLLPKHLWKPDSVATVCDNFYCRVKFNLFERRHHCRKCGGIFCAACTLRTTTLLDTSNLEFMYPPHGTLISSYDCPISPVIEARVCDDCFDQLHGSPNTPRTPELVRPALIRALSNPISMLTRPGSAGSSGESSLSSSPSHSNHMKQGAPRKTRSLRNAPSLNSLKSTPSKRVGLRASHLPLPAPELERSYGELDAYPLRRSSVLCKATGGGRWEPKPAMIQPGYRLPVPGGKAPYEIEMERKEQEAKLRQQDIFVNDGDFKYRLARKPEAL